MWQGIKDKGVKEVAKDGKKWQRIEEGWQTNKCHLLICHWSYSMRLQELSEATSRFLETSMGHSNKKSYNCKT